MLKRKGKSREPDGEPFCRSIRAQQSPVLMLAACLQIVDLIRQPHPNRCPRSAARNPAADNLFGHAPGDNANEPPINPGEALLAMMGGLFGMGQGAQAAGGAAGPAPAAPAAPRPADDSDDDMPPLEGASHLPAPFRVSATD